MATTNKVLGQIDSAVTTLETLYTVPGATSALAFTLVACNRGAADTIRVAVRPAGAAIDPKHYIYYGLPLAAGDTFASTIGITLATTDVVSVYSTTGDTSFSLFGVEET